MNKNMPAFPQSWDPNMGDGLQGGSPGLTKREYFAAIAMQGYIANINSFSASQSEIIKESIYVADALLAELERTKNAL